MNEMHADYFHHSKGFHTIGMRFFNVFGEGENENWQYASIAMQFLKNREAYYSHLLDISKNSTYQEWLKFFLTGVIYQARLVIGKINKLSKYYKEKGDSLGKYSKPTYALFQQLFALYFTTVQRASSQIGVTYPTAKKAVENLIKEGVLRPFLSSKTANKLKKRNMPFIAESIRTIYME